MAEYTSIQLAQANADVTASVQVASSSRDFHDTIGEGLLVTATGIGVVFAVLVIMILFINLFKVLEPMLDFTKKGNKESKDEAAVAGMHDEDHIDDKTIVLISAAVAAYTHNRASVRRVRVLPAKAKQGGNWAMQARSALQSSHSGKK